MTIYKWGIYRANLDPVVGSEQGKSRPVVVISQDEINELLNVVNVLPITTRKAGRSIYPNQAFLEGKLFGLQHDSIVLCYQIRTLDKRRLSTLFGHVQHSEKK